MFDNTAELAENKLLLLYILNKIKKPISNTQLTEMVLENNLINYFTLQQYISELESSKFIRYKDMNAKKLLSLTEEGISVLSFFNNRISETKKELIDKKISEKLDSIEKELTTQSDYTPLKGDNFLVELKAFEDQDILMNLKLSVPSKKQALMLCNKWQENSAQIYNEIMTVLLNDKASENK